MNFVQISSFDNYINANMQLALLQEEGINCYLKDEYTVTLDPLLSPAIGGMKLMVYEEQSQRAKEIIDEADKEFLLNVNCAVCGKNTLELITEIKKPAGLLQTISFLLINGQAQEVKKYYHCNSCGSNFDELPAEEN
jgi:Putative prokaryotic signal transducing protein